MLLLVKFTSMIINSFFDKILFINIPICVKITFLLFIMGSAFPKPLFILIRRLKNKKCSKAVEALKVSLLSFNTSSRLQM